MIQFRARPRESWAQPSFPKVTSFSQKLGPHSFSVESPGITSDACIDNNMMAFIPGSRLITPFARYLLAEVRFDYLVNPGAVPSVNEGQMRRLYTAVPPIQEQETIVRFLDREISKIDTLISKQEELIATLREDRTATISNAVTTGINPDVEMKDSGVRWLESIPVHWEVVQSRRIFTQRKGRAQPGDTQLTASQKYGVIPQREFTELEGSQVTQVILNPEILKHVEAGDFVISMRSFQGGIEYSGHTGCVSSAYVPLAPSRQVHTEFFKYALKSTAYIQALQSTSNLVRDGQALRFDHFAMVPLPALPISEQIQIADYLNNHCSKIDALINKSTTTIQVLSEYRSALIHDAVTGKIDVRRE